MKPDTVKNYPFTADYYGYRVVTSADGTVSENVYDVVPTPVNIIFSVNFVGELAIESQSKFQIDSVLRNIRDKSNTEIYENGVWSVTQTMPKINSLYLKDGYAYRATLISGDI